MSRIALVIPNRNGGGYFAELLGDIARLREWPDEIVVVDGKSTDGGCELARAFAQHHAGRSHITVVSREPKGIYDAWNCGVALATADWVHIVCSDDCIESDAYVVIRERLRKADGNDLETFDCAVVDERRRRTGLVRQLSNLHALVPGQLDEPHHRSALLEALLLFAFRSVTISFVAIMLPARLVRESQFHSEYGPSGDVEWLLRMAVNGVGVNYSPALIGAWRRHDCGATAGVSGSSRVAMQRAIRHRHLAALQKLAAYELGSRQQQQLAGMADRDVGVDFFDYLADSKSCRGRDRWSVLWRIFRIVLRKMTQAEAWRSIWGKKNFILHMRIADAKALLSGTSLLARQPIKETNR